MSDQDAMTPRVYIFRHGETEWAKSGRFTSFSTIGLTEAGVAQVSSAAARLVGGDKVLDPRRLVRVFVSPRERTRETYDLLLPPSSGVGAEKVTFTEDITEWNYGRYEGLKDKEIRKLRKGKGLDVGREWNIWSHGCEGGESREEVTERLDRIISEIKEIHTPYMLGEKPVDILLVAHGLILRCFVKRWLGLSIDHDLSMILDPGGLAILGYKNNNVNKPAFHVGLALPSEGEHGF